MLNFKTFIKTVYRNSRYFYQDFVNGYKGDEDLFVVILPVCALDNDGVVFRK